jgi:hypothetical protein
MASTKSTLGPIVLAAAVVIAGGIYHHAQHRPDVHYVKFGPGCDHIAKEYLGGLHVAASLSPIDVQNMMTELAKCHGQGRESIPQWALAQ